MPGYAVANMTGANRLLIGIAWPMVIAIGWLRFRKSMVSLETQHGLELIVLLAATVYAFTIPFRGEISLLDFVVLVSMFVFYIWRVAHLPAEEPHLVGPAKLIGSMSTRARRAFTAVIAIVAAVGILLVAKPFATSLVATGTAMGIDEFLLVQWIAPLASEAPEFVVVALFAWRGAATAALGTLVSSKINQWTLLVAMLPLVYSFGIGAPTALPLDQRQEDEILLTAAQSLFAVALLLDLRLSLTGAGALFALFIVQMIFPETRSALTVVYIVLAAIVVLMSRGKARRAFEWIRPSSAGARATGLTNPPGRRRSGTMGRCPACCRASASTCPTSKGRWTARRPAGRTSARWRSRPRRSASTRSGSPTTWASATRTPTAAGAAPGSRGRC